MGWIINVDNVLLRIHLSAAMKQKQYDAYHSLLRSI